MEIAHTRLDALFIAQTYEHGENRGNQSIVEIFKRMRIRYETFMYVL